MVNMVNVYFYGGHGSLCSRKVRTSSVLSLFRPKYIIIYSFIHLFVTISFCNESRDSSRNDSYVQPIAQNNSYLCLM